MKPFILLVAVALISVTFAEKEKCEVCKFAASTANFYFERSERDVRAPPSFSLIADEINTSLCGRTSCDDISRKELYGIIKHTFIQNHLAKTRGEFGYDRRSYTSYERTSSDSICERMRHC